MSRANSVGKVLRTAIKRLEKRWTKGSWNVKKDDGTFGVCLEGAVTGGCNFPLTDVQKDALQLIRKVGKERYPQYSMTWRDDEEFSIPDFNDDPERTQEEVIELTKLALIRWETGGMDDPEDDYIDPDKVDDILSGAMPD